MKRKIVIICLIALLFPIVSIMIGGNVQGLPEIKVAINDGYGGGFTDAIEDAIDGYSWVVNDTEYYITTQYINLGDFRNDEGFFHNNSINLHILDGNGPEVWECINDDDLRILYDEHIQEGVGFIGRCGGSAFPPPFDGNPPTWSNWKLMELNAFLGDSAPDVEAWAYSGWPVIS